MTEVVPLGTDRCPTAPRTPRSLRTKAAKASWAQVWEAGASWLRDSDVALVTLLVEALEDRERMRRQVRRDGLTTTGSMGQARSHPLLSHLLALDKQIVGMLTGLGFTPEARSRLGLVEVRQHSELELFRRRVAARRGEDPFDDPFDGGPNYP